MIVIGWKNTHSFETDLVFIGFECEYRRVELLLAISSAYVVNLQYTKKRNCFHSNSRAVGWGFEASICSCPMYAKIRFTLLQLSLKNKRKYL